VTSSGCEGIKSWQMLRWPWRNVSWTAKSVRDVASTVWVGSAAGSKRKSSFCEADCGTLMKEQDEGTTNHLKMKKKYCKNLFKSGTNQGQMRSLHPRQKTEFALPVVRNENFLFIFTLYTQQGCADALPHVQVQADLMDLVAKFLPCQNKSQHHFKFFTYKRHCLRPWLILNPSLRQASGGIGTAVSAAKAVNVVPDVSLSAISDSDMQQRHRAWDIQCTGIAAMRIAVDQRS